MPESARSVVVLPAPFAPSSVVMPPSSTLEFEPEQHLRGAVEGAQFARFEQLAHFFVVPR